MCNQPHKESRNTAALKLQVCVPSVQCEDELEQAEEEITSFLSYENKPKHSLKSCIFFHPHFRETIAKKPFKEYLASWMQQALHRESLLYQSWILTRENPLISLFFLADEIFPPC